MNAHGVEIFHGTDGEHVARSVAQDFKFDLLPSADVFFDQYLRNGRKHESVMGNEAKFLLVIRHAAAGAAQGVRGAHDDGISELFRNLRAFLYRIGDIGRNAGLMDFFHRFLEQLPVLRTVDRVELCADEFDAVLFEKARFGEFATHRKSRLTAERGEQAVGLFFEYNSL